mmetsp:Transcript_72155/g.139442  ORF Transcript_72155/g.139442 Transcript_72155/m.139442 type:complete len:293 (+) Transcript_72155:2-880(+)
MLRPTPPGTPRSPPSGKHVEAAAGGGSSRGNSPRSRTTLKPCWMNQGERSPLERPQWDNRIFIEAQVNQELPAGTRHYFNEITERPVRDELRAHIMKAHVYGKSGVGCSPERYRELRASPQGRFLRFVTTCFGSIHQAFRQLDVDNTGEICERDFCTEVRRIGFRGNPRTVFIWLDKDRHRGVIKFRDFSKLVELKKVLDAGFRTSDMPLDQNLLLPKGWSSDLLDEPDNPAPSPPAHTGVTRAATEDWSPPAHTRIKKAATFNLSANVSSDEPERRATSRSRPARDKAVTM